MLRYKGIEVAWSEGLKPGRYFLLRRAPTMQGGGDDMYYLEEEPGRTNMGREVTLRGWLGTTNDVAWYAEGAVEVSRTEAGKWVFKTVDPQELLDAAEVEAAPKARAEVPATIVITSEALAEINASLLSAGLDTYEYKDGVLQRSWRKAAAP